MGGRLLDFLGQGLAADRPVAATVPALIVPNATALYFAYDLQQLSFFNQDSVAWDEVNITALTGLFQDLADVDWSTPPSNGDLFAWDDIAGKLVPISSPEYWTLETLQDLVGAMFPNGTGYSWNYNDGTGQLELTVSVTQYTDEMAQDAIAALIAAGAHTGLTITYNDAGNAIGFVCTITQYTNEMAQDTVAAMIAAGTNTGLTITYDDAGNLIGFVVKSATQNDIWEADAPDKFITPKELFDAAAPTSVAYGATVTLDLDTGINFDIGTLTGNITMANFTNTKPGQSGVIHMVQDGTGSRVVTWGNNFRAAGGLAVGGLLSTTASAIDEVMYFVRTDGKIVLSILKDVKA